MVKFIGAIVVIIVILYFVFGIEVVDISFNDELKSRAELLLTAEEGRVKEKRHEPMEVIVREIVVTDNEDFIFVLEWCEGSVCEQKDIYVSEKVYSSTPRGGMYTPTSEDRLSDFNNETVEREK